MKKCKVSNINANGPPGYWKRANTRDAPTELEVVCPQLEDIKRGCVACVDAGVYKQGCTCGLAYVSIARQLCPS